MSFFSAGGRTPTASWSEPGGPGWRKEQSGYEWTSEGKDIWSHGGVWWVHANTKQRNLRVCLTSCYSSQCMSEVSTPCTDRGGGFMQPVHTPSFTFRLSFLLHWLIVASLHQQRRRVKLLRPCSAEHDREQRRRWTHAQLGPPGSSDSPHLVHVTMFPCSLSGHFPLWLYVCQSAVLLLFHYGMFCTFWN